MGNIAWGTALRIAWHDISRHRLRTGLSVLIVALPTLLTLGSMALGSLWPLEESRGPADHTGAVATIDVTDEQTADIGAFRRILSDQSGVDVVEMAHSAVETGDTGFMSVTTIDRPDLLRGRTKLVTGAWPTGENLVFNNAAYDEYYGDTARLGGRSLSVVGRVSMPLTVELVRGEAQYVDPPEYIATRNLFDDDFVNSRQLLAISDTPLSDATLSRLREAGASVTEHEPLSFAKRWFAISHFRVLPAQDLPLLLVPLLLSAPTVIFQIILVALLLTPSFALTIESSTRMMNRLSENGASAGARRRIMAANGLILAGFGYVLAAAFFFCVPAISLGIPASAGVFGSYMPDIMIDLFALGALYTAAAVMGAAVLVVGFRKASTRTRFVTGLSRLRLGIGLGLLAVAVALRVITSTFARSDPFVLVATLGSLTLVIVVVAMIMLAPALIAGIARVTRGWSFVWRQAALDNARMTRRTAPLLSAIAAASAIGVTATASVATIDGMNASITVKLVAPTTDALSVAEIDAGIERATPDLHTANVQWMPELYGSGHMEEGMPAAWAHVVACRNEPCEQAPSYSYDVDTMSVIFAPAETIVETYQLTGDAREAVLRGESAAVPRMSLAPGDANATHVALGTVLAPDDDTHWEADDLDVVEDNEAFLPVVMSDASVGLYDSGPDVAVPLESGIEPWTGTMDAVLMWTDRAAFSHTENARLAAEFGAEETTVYWEDVTSWVWINGLIVSLVVALFASLVIALNTRALMNRFAVWRALGARAGAVRRASAAATALLVVPAMLVGAGLGVLWVATSVQNPHPPSGSVNLQSTVESLAVVPWVPVLVLYLIVPLVTVAVAALGVRTSEGTLVPRRA